MSVRMAGPMMELENLEARRLLSVAGDAVAWDLKAPIAGTLSQKGEVDYYRFNAQVGQQLVFNSSGMKQFSILDSDGSTELDHLFIFDGINPTPGRLAWTAPHAGNFYVSVSPYSAFLIDSPTGPYSLSAYAADASRPEDGKLISAGQTVSGDLSSAGDIDYYTFDANAGTIYRFELTAPAGTTSAGHVMGVIEVQPWSPMPRQPQDSTESYPGHNLRLTNEDGQKGLGTFAEWIAPESGRYHFSIAPLDANHLGAYTLVMSQRAFPCDPQASGIDLASDWILTATTKTLLDLKNAGAKRAKHHRHHKVHHKKMVEPASSHKAPARRDVLDVHRMG